PPDVPNLVWDTATVNLRPPAGQVREAYSRIIKESHPVERLPLQGQVVICPHLQHSKLVHSSRKYSRGKEVTVKVTYLKQRCQATDPCLPARGRQSQEQLSQNRGTPRVTAHCAQIL